MRDFTHTATRLRCALFLFLILHISRVVVGSFTCQSSCPSDGTKRSAIVSVSANSRLEYGQSLNPGDSLNNGVFSLVMQKDCDLVLYASGSREWYTGSEGTNCILKMQEDGNLVIYRDYGAAPVWASQSMQPNSAKYHLELQNDRNVVIYTEDHKAIWASDTSIGD